MKLQDSKDSRTMLLTVNLVLDCLKISRGSSPYVPFEVKKDNTVMRECYSKDALAGLTDVRLGKLYFMKNLLKTVQEFSPTSSNSRLGEF